MIKFLNNRLSILVAIMFLASCKNQVVFPKSPIANNRRFLVKNKNFEQKEITKEDGTSNKEVGGLDYLKAYNTAANNAGQSNNSNKESGSSKKEDGTSNKEVGGLDYLKAYNTAANNAGQSNNSNKESGSSKKEDGISNKEVGGLDYLKAYNTAANNAGQSNNSNKESGSSKKEDGTSNKEVGGLDYLKAYNTAANNAGQSNNSNKESGSSKKEDGISNKEVGLDYLKAYNTAANNAGQSNNSNKESGSSKKEDGTSNKEVGGLDYLKAYNTAANNAGQSNNSNKESGSSKKEDGISNKEVGLDYLKSYNTVVGYNKSDNISKPNQLEEFVGNNQCLEVYDPYEKFNRKIYKFNSIADYFLLRPVSLMYDKLTNNYIKARVDSALDNINTPISTVNYLFQGNYTGTLHNFWRFIINSTIGVAGIFDVATKMGLPRNPQNFGDTLAYYGVAPGPYIMLPIFGGTTVRGLLDQIVTVETCIPVKMVSSSVRACQTGCKMIHYRSKILPYTDELMKNSLDSYINVRSSIFQNKESGVKYPKNFVCPKIKK